MAFNLNLELTTNDSWDHSRRKLKVLQKTYIKNEIVFEKFFCWNILICCFSEKVFMCKVCLCNEMNPAKNLSMIALEDENKNLYLSFFLFPSCFGFSLSFVSLLFLFFVV